MGLHRCMVAIIVQVLLSNATLRPLTQQPQYVRECKHGRDLSVLASGEMQAPLL